MTDRTGKIDTVFLVASPLPQGGDVRVRTPGAVVVPLTASLAPDADRSPTLGTFREIRDRLATERDYYDTVFRFYGDLLEASGLHRLFRIGETSLWWSMNQTVSRFFIDLLIDLDALHELVDISDPEALAWVGPPESATALLARALCEARGMGFRALPPPAGSRPERPTWRDRIAAARHGPIATMLRHLLDTRLLLDATPQIDTFVWSEADYFASVRGTDRGPETIVPFLESVLREMDRRGLRWRGWHGPPASLVPRRGRLGRLRRARGFRTLQGYRAAFRKSRAGRTARRELAQVGERFRATWERAGRDPALRSALRVRGTDLFPAVDAEMRRRFLQRMLDTLFEQRFYEDLLPRLGVRSVLACNEYYHQGLILAARALGIPVAAIQHGQIHRSHFGYILPKGLEAPGFVLADTTLLYGRFFRDLLVEHSVYPEDRVEVVGHPRADLVVHRGYTRSSVRRALGIPEEATVILLATQHLVPPQEWLFEQFARSVPPCRLIIKYHPAERQQPRYEALIRRLGIPDVIRLQDYDLYAALTACDVHMTAFSTTVLDSALLMRPVLLFEVPRFKDFVGYKEQRFAAHLSDFADLGQAVRALTDPASPERKAVLRRMEEYLERYYHRVDGKTGARVVDALERLLDRPPSESS
jgi:hypothetical protein